MRTTTLWISVVVVALSVALVVADAGAADGDQKPKPKRYRGPPTDIFGKGPAKPADPRVIDHATPVYDRKADPSFVPVASKQPANLKPVPAKAPHGKRHPDPTWKWANVAVDAVKPKLLRGPKDESVPANLVNPEPVPADAPPKHVYVRAHIRDRDAGRAAPPPPKPVSVSAHDVTRYGFAEPPKLTRRQRNLVVADAHITADDDGHRAHTRRHREPRVPANAHIVRDDDGHRAHKKARRVPREFFPANAHITRGSDGHRDHLAEARAELRKLQPRELVSAEGHISGDDDGHWLHRREARREKRYALHVPDLVSARVRRTKGEMSIPQTLPPRAPAPEPELVSARVRRSRDEWVEAQELPPRAPVPDERHPDNTVSARVRFPRF